MVSPPSSDRALEVGELASVLQQSVVELERAGEATRREEVEAASYFRPLLVETLVGVFWKATSILT